LVFVSCIIASANGVCEECTISGPNWKTKNFVSLNGQIVKNDECPFQGNWFSLFSKARCLSERSKQGV